MRYLRFVPLLVLLGSASASADDHRVDFAFAGSYASGSHLVGLHASGGVSVLHPLFTAVVDSSRHNGSHDGSAMSRTALLFGGRWTYTRGQNDEHKLLPQFLIGPVSTKIGDIAETHAGFAPGIGYEYIPRRENREAKYATGFYAQVDYVFTTGSEVGFVRMSAGGILRFRK